MIPILPNGGRSTACRPSLWLGLALLLAVGVVPASTDQEVPDGLPVGPVLFTPWFQTEVLADDNIFRRSENGSPGPEADVATTLRGGVAAIIPIRMSNLEIGYEGSTFSYRDTDFSGTETHTGFVVFDLNFSSHNTLHIEETYTRGVTELLRFSSDIDSEGNIVLSQEIIRQGVPFAHNVWAVEWLREVARRPAWRARIERSDLRYRPDELPLVDGETQAIPWLDHEGWEVEYEYVQPIYRRGGLTAKYNARRQDQFEPVSNLNSPVPGSVLLRREVYDGLEVGYRGLISRRQPLVVSLGYGKLAFRDVQVGDEPSNYRGLVGRIHWGLPIGGLSNMAITLDRRPLSSIFNTYYIINEVRVRFDRRFRGVSRWGVNLLASSNGYGDIVKESVTGGFTLDCIDPAAPVAPGADPVLIVRHDRGQRVEGFWEWFIQPRITLRMAATHNRRNSNCDQLSFRSNGLSMTFKVGWF